MLEGTVRVLADNPRVCVIIPEGEMTIKASIKAHGFERFQNKKKHLNPSRIGGACGPIFMPGPCGVCATSFGNCRCTTARRRPGGPKPYYILWPEGAAA